MRQLEQPRVFLGRERNLHPGKRGRERSTLNS
jgi:hypothetical protein